MAVLSRLTIRLSIVPGIDGFNFADWLDEAVAESNVTEEENENAILYLALAIAYESLALKEARSFKYTDGEESVDKTNVYSNYMALAKDARKQYRSHLRGFAGASQTHVGRADKR